jgi:hypothetical protein
MDWIMNKHEKVPQEIGLLYWVVYESVFNESLNAKRSTCETAGRKIVVDKTMPKFQEKGKELITMEELCKQLRRAETEREKEAFFWYFGKFLSCVVGKGQWSVQKQYQLISRATMTGSSDKLVTISNEAFALLMYENYKDKWTKRVTNRQDNRCKAERKQFGESSPFRTLGRANMAGGVMPASNALMSCTTWLLRTGLAYRLLQWKRSSQIKELVHIEDTKP